MPKISVIVPVFGVEKYIERCARSLFDQTLDDIELIFVNDGTKDNSIGILNKVQEEYPERRAIILNHSENRGLPEARRTGLANASGDYIAHCDSDDWVDPDYCKVMYETAISTESDVVVCGYWLSNGQEKWEDNRFNDRLYEDKDKALPSSLALASSPFVWNKLVKRDLYTRQLMYPTHYLGEDWVMSVQYAVYSSKTSVIENKLYYYFVNPESQRLLNDKEACIKKCMGEAANVKLIRDWLETIGMLKCYNGEILKRISIVKKQLMPVIDDKECRKVWRRLFSDSNIGLLFCKLVRSDIKRIHFFVITGLYGPAKYLMNLIK